MVISVTFQADNVLQMYSSQFADQCVLGPQTYDTARQLTESEDWEKEVKGLEMIVAISRDSPEVSDNCKITFFSYFVKLNIFGEVVIQIEELQNSCENA